MTDFSADIGLEGSTAVVTLRGDIDRRAADGLPAAYATASAAGARTILLDFERVGFVNSTGIALVVGLLAEASADGRPVSACGLSEHYRTIFDITRLTDHMRLYPDVATALAAAMAT